MKFWDSSAIIPLLVQEKTTVALTRLAQGDSEMSVWWATEIECAAALSRHERSGSIPNADLAEGFRRLQRFARGWFVIEPREQLKDLAKRLLRVHPLRTADALQLAAALVYRAEGSPLDFVCLDERLCSAAEREGFIVIGT